MVAPNGISESLDRWWCYPCQRWFVSEQAIHAHCRTAGVHSGKWCDRCKWLFTSPSAMTNHTENSSRHHVCDRCPIDFLTYADYEDHLESEHSYCRPCQILFTNCWGHESPSLLRSHRVEAHFMCPKCDTFYKNQNNVDQHQRVHLPRDKECYGCYRKFPSLSAMMIHLEAGTCSSQTRIDDIDRWASEYLENESYTSLRTPNGYGCPGCHHIYSYLSGLFQHLESNACGGTIEGNLPTLDKYLKNSISQQMSSRNVTIAYVGGITASY